MCVRERVCVCVCVCVCVGMFIDRGVFFLFFFLFAVQLDVIHEDFLLLLIIIT